MSKEKNMRDFKYYWEEQKPSPVSQSGILIREQLPGFKKGEINIQIDGNTLKISAYKTSKKEQKGENFFLHKSASSSVSRVVSLPQNVNPNDLETSYEDGILTISLKKKKSKKTF